MKEVSKLIKKYRKEANYSQAELAEIAGLSKSLISKIEAGYKKPTINAFIKICSALNIPYSEAADVSSKLLLGEYSEENEKREFVIDTINTSLSTTECIFDNFPMFQAKEATKELNLDFSKSQLAILSLLATKDLEIECNYTFEELKKDKNRLINIVNQIFITIRNDSAFHNSLK